MSSPDPYSPPSFRGVIIMAIVIILGIAFVWWAFANVVDTDLGRSEDLPNQAQVQEMAV